MSKKIYLTINLKKKNHLTIFKKLLKIFIRASKENGILPCMEIGGKKK